MPPQIPYDHTPSNIASLIAETQNHGIQHSLDFATRNAKANTPHSPVPAHETPLVVFLPTSTLQTSQILRGCNARRIAVTSFSGGTSFGGALTAVAGGVCVSFEKMDRVLRVNEEDMDVVVQPGVGWVELNEGLRERGVWFPVDPAPGARVGGMVSCVALDYLSCSRRAVEGRVTRGRCADVRADCDVVFRDECVPVWYYERMGYFAHCCIG